MQPAKESTFRRRLYHTHYLLRLTIPSCRQLQSVTSNSADGAHRRFPSSLVPDWRLLIVDMEEGHQIWQVACSSNPLIIRPKMPQGEAEALYR